jgi:hypothetical protein
MLRGMEQGETCLEDHGRVDHLDAAVFGREACCPALLAMGLLHLAQDPRCAEDFYGRSKYYNVNLEKGEACLEL